MSKCHTMSAELVNMVVHLSFGDLVCERSHGSTAPASTCSRESYRAEGLLYSGSSRNIQDCHDANGSTEEEFDEEFQFEGSDRRAFDGRSVSGSGLCAAPD